MNWLFSKSPEQEREELKKLIRHFITNEIPASPSAPTQQVKNIDGTVAPITQPPFSLTSDYVRFQELKEKHKDWIVTHRTSLVEDSTKYQPFFNSLNRDWRSAPDEKLGGRRKRTRHRRKKNKYTKRY